MPPRRPRLRFVSTDPQAFDDLAILHNDDWTLGRLLSESPAFALEALDPDYLKVALSSLNVGATAAAEGVALHLPPGVPLAALCRAGPGGDGQADEAAAEITTDPDVPGDAAATGAGRELAEAGGHPENLGERAAVLIAHQVEIDRVGAYLRRGLSVLIQCEKLLVEHLIDEIVGQSGRTRTVIKAEAGEAAESPLGLPPAGRRASLLAALEREVNDDDEDRIVVVPHLDLLAGGSNTAISSEARELTDVLYERSTRVLLAFTDPSLVLPEVLADRFAVRLSLDVLPREVAATDGRPVPVGQALVRREEAELFARFDPVALYKNIAGMNAVRLRLGMRFAYHEHHQRPSPTFTDLLQELALFKAHTSNSFEVPNVPFDRIGGYQPVKDELRRALTIISGAAAGLADLPEPVRQDLVPRGFIFHGPPGTGKTLFAKAVATELNATVLVVSGPEVTDMYVGESERKVRELFAEARRNAPSVLVFDEFDSIAAKRTGRDDGGSRAGNAVVAQLLTELDGFRPEVPVLIIGTTNRIDIIDDALLRPSRFRAIKIDLPDEQARQAIARVHAEAFLRERPGEELLRAISRATEGFNGDEIRSIFRDARADELINGPAARPDAHRLGELIGALHRERQQREADQRRPAGRPAPDTAYIALDARARPFLAEMTVPAQPTGNQEGGHQ
ncbi:ATP-binding protein [Actinomadura graeca]|uniref:ATP-binding protein n=1 Tax=Actinomadura graeca TaxID=2750812 RepID=A0ABX8QNJ2_9ACTN|nr:ATP-binding protein [Actinomadura graeca]QXJ20206.1 ATP-binding protein [Actinomadura graeca]